MLSCNVGMLAHSFQNIKHCTGVGGTIADEEDHRLKNYYLLFKIWAAYHILEGFLRSHLSCL